MTFGITFNNAYTVAPKFSGIDQPVVKEVAQEILARAGAKSGALSTVDLSKFNRPDTGMDLYNGNVTPDVAKNIALQNSGQNVSLNREVQANIQYLNTQAAKAAFETPAKNMEGKINAQPNESISNSERAHAPLPNSTTFFDISNLSKDSDGNGNPFYANTGGNTGTDDGTANE